MRRTSEEPMQISGCYFPTMDEIMRSSGEDELEDLMRTDRK